MDMWSDYRRCDARFILACHLWILTPTEFYTLHSRPCYPVTNPGNFITEGAVYNEGRSGIRMALDVRILAVHTATDARRVMY